MRRPHQRLAGAAILLALPLLWGAGCRGDRNQDPTSTAAPKLPVPIAVTIPPLAWLADEVGGERVETTVLIPPGNEPHAYEPSPRDIAATARARVFVLVGHPLLSSERRFVEPLLASRAEVEVVRVVEWESYVGNENPHVWLDPDHMAAAARRLAAALGRIDPAGAAVYERRLGEVERRIAEVDGEIAALLEGLPRQGFLVFHPAWQQFAYHYGLVEHSIETYGKEPTPGELAARIENARAQGFGTVFLQRGLADRPARVVADEIGARVVTLDPLAREWDDNLLAVGRALRDELARPFPEESPGASEAAN